MSDRLTFNKAIDALKARQKPSIQTDIFSSLFGVDLSESGIDFSQVTHFLEDKIEDSAKLIKTRVGELENKVQRKPWRYIALSLGVGLIGGLVLCHRYRSSDIRIS